MLEGPNELDGTQNKQILTNHQQMNQINIRQEISPNRTAYKSQPAGARH